MTNHVEELFERAESQRAVQTRDQNDKVERISQRRRRRREHRRPRLRFVPKDGGGTLYVPTTAWSRILGLYVAASGLYASFVFAQKILAKSTALAVHDYIWLILVLGFGPLMCQAAASVFATWRIDILSGRGYVARQRTALGFLRVVEADTDPGIRFRHESSGLLEVTWGSRRFFDLGSADVALMQRACASAGIPIRLPTTEEYERADRFEGRGIERFVLQMIATIFGISGGLIALVYYSQQAKLDEYAAPNLPANAELAGLARSRGAESWGEWSIQPSKITSGGGAGAAGFTIAFPEGGPVRELRFKMEDEERQTGHYLEWHFVGESAPRKIVIKESCQSYKFSAKACKNPDGTWDAQDRTQAYLRFECWKYGIDGTFISNCPPTKP